jgi:cell division protein FtsI (penicillin-binding protein 3)
MRRPLRPLAGVIRARAQGDDPDAVEAQRRAERLHAARAQERRRAEWRLLLLAVVLFGAFLAASARMALVAVSDPAEPERAIRAATISGDRGDIVDRAGRLLATNLPTTGLYVEPRRLVDPRATAEGLARIFPGLDAATTAARIRQGRFFSAAREMSPEQRQAVFDLGEPGLVLAPRQARLYPAGRPVAHLVGAAGIGEADVWGAEIVGTAGVEYWFDSRLRDPARSPDPLVLSIDLAVQTALRDELLGGIATYRAKGAAGVLLDARNGEVVALVSLPDFDPNDRPSDPHNPLLRSLAVQSLHELGSTFKLFAAATALERGLLRPDTLVNTAGPILKDGFRIRDSHRMPSLMTLRDVIVESSNIGAARIALMAGTAAQQDMLSRLGLLDPVPVELPEAAQVRPQRPARWTELSTMTIAYGHGVSSTPLHLAAAYAALVNGGFRVRPTLLRGAPLPGEAERVISAATSFELRRILRGVVAEEEGTGNMAEVPGYLVGGKTGTGNKPVAGGYDEDRTVATFAAIFPAPDPAYVLVVTLDEPSIFAAGEIRRTAGWTAAPLAGQTIRRIAPILGLRPVPGTEPEPATDAVAIPVRR